MSGAERKRVSVISGILLLLLLFFIFSCFSDIPPNMFFSLSLFLSIYRYRYYHETGRQEEMTRLLKCCYSHVLCAVDRNVAVGSLGISGDGHRVGVC
jgi:hypothetical protein